MREQIIDELKREFYLVPKNLPSEAKKSDGIDVIINHVAGYFKIPVDQLKSKSRKREVCYPRQVAAFLCLRLIKKVTQDEIGQAIGGKDHATVIHSRNAINNLMDTDKGIKVEIYHIEEVIKTSYPGIVM